MLRKFFMKIFYPAESPYPEYDTSDYWQFPSKYLYDRGIRQHLVEQVTATHVAGDKRFKPVERIQKKEIASL